MEDIRSFRNAFGYGSIEMRLMATHVHFIMFDLMRNTRLIEQEREEKTTQTNIQLSGRFCCTTHTFFSSLSPIHVHHILPIEIFIILSPCRKTYNSSFSAYAEIISQHRGIC